MGAGALVFGVGDEISGWGRLVRNGGDWFDPPLPTTLVGYGPDGPPAPSPSEFAIPVIGADFDTVAHRYERDGAIEGYTAITGRWLGDRISIEKQTNNDPAHRFPRWTDPPCPAPAGGWPRGESGGNLTFDLGELQNLGIAVTTVIFRPSDDQQVLVVAATDIATVEAHLGPQLAESLCVVPSRWTRDQLDRAHQHLRHYHNDWEIYVSGQSFDEQAQATVSATLVRVTNEIADWASAQPDGLITLEPCLGPAKQA